MIALSNSSNEKCFISAAKKWLAICSPIKLIAESVTSATWLTFLWWSPTNFKCEINAEKESHQGKVLTWMIMPLSLPEFLIYGSMILAATSKSDGVSLSVGFSNTVLDDSNISTFNISLSLWMLWNERHYYACYIYSLNQEA